MLGRQRVRIVKVILRRLLIFAANTVVPKYGITIFSSWRVTSCLRSDSTHAQVCENRGMGTPVKGKIVQCERFIGPQNRTCCPFAGPINSENLVFCH
jgi:hypothetical protein